MTRWQYCLYLLRRILLAFATVAGFSGAVIIAQRFGLLPRANWKPLIVPLNHFALAHFSRAIIHAPAARALEFWSYPILSGILGYIGFGPKQRTPIYRYYGPEYSRAYAGVKQDFNAASRGDKVTGATGTGKCWHPDTQIMMYDGTARRVADVKTGDLLMGPDSKPREVLSTTRGTGPLFRIVPRDGSDPWICNDAHVMTLTYTTPNGVMRSSRSRAHGCKVRHRIFRGQGQVSDHASYSTPPPQVVDVPLDDFLRRTRTAIRFNSYHVSQYWKLFRVPVEFPGSVADQYPVDHAYLAGLWLGDGSRSWPEITTKDPEVVRFLTEFAKKHGYAISHYHDPRSAGLTRVYFKTRVKSIAPFLAQFLTPEDPDAPRPQSHRFVASRHNPSRHNRGKIIPHAFKTATPAHRLALLAGILDSDGSYDSRGGCFDYCSTEKRLATDVQWLARSLGFRATSTVRRARDARIDYECTAYRVRISGAVHRIPTRISRKAARARLQKKQHNVFGWKVQPLGPGDYCGFTINGDGRLLLADFTVTHNTQICLNPINETQTIHMRGIEKKSWKRSKARRVYQELKAQFKQQTAQLNERLRQAQDKRDHVMENLYTPAVEAFAEILFLYLIRAYSSLTDAASLSEAAVRDFETAPMAVKGENPTITDIAKTAGRAKGDEPLSYEVLREILDTSSSAALLAEHPLVLPANAPRDLRQAGLVWQKARQALTAAEENIELIYNSINLRRQELSRAADLLRPLRYKAYPWGGGIYDQKGNCYQQIQPMLERYDRPEDVVVLQVRPANAPASWQPANRVNVLSFDHFPADTYAKIIADTYNQVEECDKPDPFFVPNARNSIADGIRLMRAIRTAQRNLKFHIDPAMRVLPALDQVHELLKDSSGSTFRHFLVRIGVRALTAKKQEEIKKHQGDKSTIQITPADLAPGLYTDTAVDGAISTLEISYFKQPADQLGGIASTIDNFLKPFSEPSFAEVFCRDNTVNFTDVEKGKVFCISIPQRFSLQRVYINALVSEIIYQIILNRGDLRKEGDPLWDNRNVIRQEKDEAQRLAINADTNVDTIRELYGSTALASQSNNALWKRFGGREKATEPLSNLCNLFICRAANDECAKVSAELISKAIFAETSSSGKSGEEKSHTTSHKEHYIIPPEELRSLSDFNVIFAPAEGKYLFVHVVPCPVMPRGGVPPWWFGEINPIKLAARLFHVPQYVPKKVLWVLPLPGKILGLRVAGRKILWFNPARVVPIWKAKAWRANPRIAWRYIFGLDTTWYIVRKMTRKEAQRRATNREHLS